MNEMPALPKAIIHTPTEAEAIRFLEFAREYGYQFPSYESHGETCWDEYQEDTCYDTEDTEICYADMDDYRENKENWFWPDDPQLAFCTVDEFISYVIGDEPEEDPIEGLTALLDGKEFYI